MQTKEELIREIERVIPLYQDYLRNLYIHYSTGKVPNEIMDLFLKNPYECFRIIFSQPSQMGLDEYILSTYHEDSRVSVKEKQALIVNCLLEAIIKQNEPVVKLLVNNKYSSALLSTLPSLRREIHSAIFTKNARIIYLLLASIKHPNLDYTPLLGAYLNQLSNPKLDEKNKEKKSLVKTIKSKIPLKLDKNNTEKQIKAIREYYRPNEFYPKDETYKKWKEISQISLPKEITTYIMFNFFKALEKPASEDAVHLGLDLSA